MNDKTVSRHSERGVVLVLVLVLAAVSIAVITALIYLITTGTQTSGMQKRYHSALEAGMAASGVVTQVLAVHDSASAVSTFLTTTLSKLNISTSSSLGPCGGTAYLYTSGTPTTFTGIAAKIMTSSTTWGPVSACSTSLSTGPSTYDMKFEIGSNPTYSVYAKIVDTVEGNTNGSNTGGHSLVTTGVVAAKSGGGEISMVTIPYQYTIEVDAENARASTTERAKLEVLYQY